MVITWPDGATEVRTFTVAAGASEVVEIGDHVSPSSPPPVVNATPPPPPAANDSGRSHRVPATVWVAFGGSVVFAGAAVALGLETLDARKAFEASNETSTNAHDQAVRYRLLTNVAWGFVAASAAMGATFLVVSLTRDRGVTRTALTVTPSERTVGLRYRF
jgi:hypothetical protein